MLAANLLPLQVQCSYEYSDEKKEADIFLNDVCVYAYNAKHVPFCFLCHVIVILLIYAYMHRGTFFFSFV